MVTQSDQAATTPGVIWSSNGTGSVSADVSEDKIPGIGNTATPTYSDFTTFFAATYPSLTVLPPSFFATCTGLNDGNCNTNNILAFYNYYFTATPTYGQTPLTDYAAGLCKATISGYSDWYLPAICEMGAAGEGAGCASNIPNIVDNLPSLIGTSPTNCAYVSAHCLAGLYWSSTEVSNDPQSNAWIEVFLSGGSLQNFYFKAGQLGVRCSRALIT